MKGDKLPDIIRRLRVDRNFSQEYVAEYLGISLSSYSRYENDKVQIDFNSVVKLADLYKLTLDDMYRGVQRTEIAKSGYTRSNKISVTVELDGDKETLDYWIDKLTAINKIV